MTTLISLALSLLAAMTRPASAIAPPGWHVHGVRPDGRYELLRAPTWPTPVCSPTPNACVGDEPIVAVQARVYCVEGERAVAVDWRRVGCR